MHISFTSKETAFQKDVRQFFTEKYPEAIKHKQNNAVTLSRDDFVTWQKILFKQGWAGINWPQEHGGTGWTPVQKYIFAIEDFIGAKICSVSTSPERKDTILIENPFDV